MAMPIPLLRTLMVLLSCFLSSSCLTHKIGGAFTHEPEELSKSLSPGALDLIRQSFRDITPDSLVDYHTHIVGTGRGGTGSFINPEMQSLMHPIKMFKTKVYMSASGIKDMETADQEYVSRLVSLVESINNHGKYRILALDKYYRPDGSCDAKKTSFYVPNEYIFNLSREYPDLFLPVISVHPYRPDALQELERWAVRGIKYMKWLPNAMGIDLG